MQHLGLIVMMMSPGLILAVLFGVRAKSLNADVRRRRMERIARKASAARHG